MSASKELFSNPLANYEAFSTYGSFNAQMARIKDMVDRQESITAKVNDYKNIHTDLSGNTDYKDYNFTKTDGKIWLDYVDRKSDVKDAAKEDVRTMIIEQNNAYIIGMVTLATVLVTTFLVLK